MIIYKRSLTTSLSKPWTFERLIMRSVLKNLFTKQPSRDETFPPSTPCIPEEVCALIARINARYKSLECWGETDEEKLQRMIEYINTDQDLFRLNSWSLIGALLMIYEGTSLIFDHEGLQIYLWTEWDFFSRDRTRPASVKLLKQYGLTAEKLRDLLASYSEYRNYYQHVRSYNKKFEAPAAA